MTTRTPHAAPPVAWGELREAAVQAALRGWPLAVGTYPAASNKALWYGRDGATGLAPVRDDWADAPPIVDPDHAELVWTQKPYGALVVCGKGVDVLQVPAEVAEGLPALGGAGLATPVSVTAPPPRWLLWVATGTGQLHEELAKVGAQLHSTGAWVALPPTNLGPIRTRWRAEPRQGADLPDADRVQDVLVEARRHGLPDAVLG